MQIALFCFLAIGLRAWHLEVVQREEKVRLSQQPKKRTLLQKADRGILTDRFGNPLAVNKICYNAAIYYNQINAIRRSERKEYIKNLSTQLASVLGLDAPRIEDLIHSKASLFPHAPFLLKTALTEEEHYRLASLEREWPGVHAEIASERFYPRGKTACAVLGSMGAISSKKYLSIAQEIQLLQEIVDDWELGIGVAIPAPYGSFDAVLRRLEELKENAYTLQDFVGKSGIESELEQTLRGSFGKQIVECDHKGNYLRQIPGGKKATAGKNVALSISVELQELAEQLLAHDEGIREGKSIGLDPETRERKILKQPWIKGGSIVVMDPNTGEILALASQPRFDPNDFAHKGKEVHRWLETPQAIGAIWNGEEPWVRERHTKAKGWHEERAMLSWERYLNEISPTPFPVSDVKTAVQLQEDIETLLYHTPFKKADALLDALYAKSERVIPSHAEALKAWRRIDSLLAPLSSTAERLFVIDLCRLVVHAPALSDSALRVLGPMKLGAYRAINQAIHALEKKLRADARRGFQAHEFRLWREANQKEFLAAMRKEEKKSKAPPKPYLDFLDQKERELFDAAWQEKRLDVLATAILSSPECACLAQPLLEDTKAILHAFRSYEQLERPLLGTYKALREQTERGLAGGFYPKEGFGFSRSYAFQTSGPEGSLFKLVTAYAALLHTHGSNPLTIVDEWKPEGKLLSVASTPGGVPYPRMYKGGRLPKSSSSHIGKIDLVGALERSSNPYFSLLAGDVLNSPEELKRIARLLGFGAPTGIELPGEVGGNLPTDLSENKTGLYSTAFGQHTLLTTPLQNAVMLGSLANKGKLLKPTIVKELRSTCATPEESAEGQEELARLGVAFPLFGVTSPAIPKVAANARPQIIRTIDLPPLIRSQLLEGMDKAVWSDKGTARPAIIKNLIGNSAVTDGFLALRHQMIGKTSTAEITHNPYINPASSASMYKHIGFGAISFDPKGAASWETPELVVVVYLRFGDAGKEAAPIAAQLIAKWREIKDKNTKSL